jgi:DNA (cytosine-5)-methyltransferase 1
MDRSILSLFAGAGGCSLGFNRADFNIQLGIDIDSDAINTYQANFPETDVVEKDISDTNSDWLLDRLGLEPGELDFLIGGSALPGFQFCREEFLG